MERVIVLGIIGDGWGPFSAEAHFAEEALLGLKGVLRTVGGTIYHCGVLDALFFLEAAAHHAMRGSVTSLSTEDEPRTVCAADPVAHALRCLNLTLPVLPHHVRGTLLALCAMKPRDTGLGELLRTRGGLGAVLQGPLQDWLPETTILGGSPWFLDVSPWSPTGCRIELRLLGTHGDASYVGLGRVELLGVDGCVLTARSLNVSGPEQQDEVVTVASVDELEVMSILVDDSARRNAAVVDDGNVDLGVRQEVSTAPRVRYLCEPTLTACPSSINVSRDPDSVLPLDTRTVGALVGAQGTSPFG